MALKHATTKTPGQKVFAVSDWNAEHLVDGDVGGLLYRGAAGQIEAATGANWDAVNKILKLGDSSKGGEFSLRTTGINRDLSFFNAGLTNNIAHLACYPTTGVNVSPVYAISPRGAGFSASAKAILQIFNTDWVADPINYEGINIWTAGADYRFVSVKAGTGQLRPIKIVANDSTGASNQFVLQTDGTVGRNTLNPQAGFHNVGDTRLGDQATNYTALTATGDVEFVGGSGLQYGCINYHGAGVSVTCTNQNEWYQVVAFDNNSQFNGDVIVDQANNKIIVGLAGDYQTFLGVSGSSTTANNDFEVAVSDDDGTSVITPITVHQATATANRVQTGSMQCFNPLAADDELTVWVRCTSAGGKVWNTDHVVLNTKQIGGDHS